MAAACAFTLTVLAGASGADARAKLPEPAAFKATLSGSEVATVR